jgi:hypothetical protein
VTVSLPPAYKAVASGMQAVQTSNSLWTTLWSTVLPSPGSIAVSQNLAQLDVIVSVFPGVSTALPPASGGSVRLVNVTDNIVVGSVSFSDTTPATYSIDATSLQASNVALEIQAMTTGAATAMTVHAASLLYPSK